MAVFDSRPNTHPIHHRSYIKGNIMENLNLIAQAMGHTLQKGGQGYEIINRHGLRIFNEPTLYAAAFYLARLVKHRDSLLQAKI